MGGAIVRDRVGIALLPALGREHLNASWASRVT